MTHRLSIDGTLQFHDRLAAALPDHGAQLASALRGANQGMRDRGMTLGRLKPLEVSLSALLLSDDDEARLRDVAGTLHNLVEKVLDWLVARPDRLERMFPEHRRMFPFLAKTRGIDSWQVVSRYDVAVTRDGRLKILELNTGCPGAFLISEAVSLETHGALTALPTGLLPKVRRIATVTPDGLIDRLLEIEKCSGIRPATIGVLQDENKLDFELDLLAAALRSRRRDVVVADARELVYEQGQLRWRDRVLSLTWNKFRVSTPHSPNHCWKDGFEQRYAAFLAAGRDGAVVSVNNLMDMTVAEDKTLLGLLRDPEFDGQLSPVERQFVDDCVPWTARLEPGQALWNDAMVDLLPLIQRHPERFVIKPANEGRGFGVVVGKWAGAEQWQQACRVDPNLPRIVQEYVEPVSFPVLHEHGGELDVQDMYLTLGLGVVAGTYQGIVSRISADPVTNVARDGYGQAVFCVASS